MKDAGGGARRPVILAGESLAGFIAPLRPGNFVVPELSVLMHGRKALARSRFWQTWALLAFFATAFAGARLLSPTSNAPERAPSRASAYS
ncbi:MAG TPA: hypothetical protein VJV79_21615 [Polyangiaceae bacterium]|nr:hypothetical protein [Polyangiaceae bacterium]